MITRADNNIKYNIYGSYYVYNKNIKQIQYNLWQEL